MDAKFSDAHALGHKRTVHPKFIFYIETLSPTTRLNHQVKKKKKMQFKDHENSMNCPFNLKPQMSDLHLTKPSFNSKGEQQSDEI